MRLYEVRSVQFAAQIIGAYELRGNEAIASLRFQQSGAAGGEQEKGVADALMLYGTAAARQLGRVRNVLPAAVLDSVRPPGFGAFPGPVDWAATVDLMKMIDSGTPLRAVRRLTLDSALATSFNVSLALTRELAAMEGRPSSQVADEIGCSVESWGSRRSIFERKDALAPTLAGANHLAEQHLRRTTARLLIECCQATAGRLLAAGSRIRRPDPSRPTAYGYGDDRIAALGYLCLSIASVGAAIIELAERNTYATSALLCRLTDTEFLIWAFSENSSTAAAWLQSSTKEHNGRTATCDGPRSAADNFPGDGDGIPCTVGHRPSPVELRKLISSSDPIAAETALSELIHHASNAWRYLVAAVDVIAEDHSINPDTLIMEMVDTRIRAAVDDWRRKDELRHEVRLFAETDDVL